MPYQTLPITFPPVFEPLLSPARYKAAHGGRGSGKSHFFAGLAVDDCLSIRGLRILCVREVQRSLKDSVKRLIEDKLRTAGLGRAQGFRVHKELIETPGDGVMVFRGMQDHTAESIKSLEGFNRAWVEEAQTLSAHSLRLLRPTLRTEGSQLWFSWNPRRAIDPVDLLLRGAQVPSDATIVEANWSDNPYFTAELDQERRDCLRIDPDSYEHIWEGDYATFISGAYYTASLGVARREGRLRPDLAYDPLLPLRAFWDIGLRDSTAIWLAQQNGEHIHIIDYYEAAGQPLATHLTWLREHGYGSAECVLPHDGTRADTFTATRYEDHIRAQGFTARSVPNQGAGAALKRIEAGRQIFPRLIFNEPACRGGLDALGAYHERRDLNRNIGLGPEHDWASHAADAFGLLAIVFGRRQKANPRLRKLD